MGDCSTQRVLSEVGWKEAKDIGEGFRKNAIPFYKVISSQYCRAQQTADLGFGQYEKNGALNFPLAEDYTVCSCALAPNIYQRLAREQDAPTAGKWRSLTSKKEIFCF